MFLNSNSPHDQKKFLAEVRPMRIAIVWFSVIHVHILSPYSSQRPWSSMIYVSEPRAPTTQPSAAGECLRWTTKVGLHFSHSLSRSSNDEDIVWNWIKVLCVHLFSVMHEHGTHRKKFSIWCEFGIPLDARWRCRPLRRRALREYLALNLAIFI